MPITRRPSARTDRRTDNIAERKCPFLQGRFRSFFVGGTLRKFAALENVRIFVRKMRLKWLIYALFVTVLLLFAGQEVRRCALSEAQSCEVKPETEELSSPQKVRRAAALCAYHPFGGQRSLYRVRRSGGGGAACGGERLQSVVPYRRVSAPLMRHIAASVVRTDRLSLYGVRLI